MSHQLLVVEDDADIAGMLVMILEDEGYRVARASDGQQALDWLAAGGKPQLILLDLMMPRVDGWQFLARRRELPTSPQCPVVVLSGADARVLPDGASAIVRKPVPIDELLDLVARQLQRAG
jgi:CheY-like chemotaxis protein